MKRAFVAVSVGIVWILNFAAVASAQPPATQPPAAQQPIAQQSAATQPAPTQPTPSQPAASAAQPSPIKIAPYGILYFNLFDNSAGTNNGDVPLWSTAGPGSLSASGRQSRFGFRVTGLTAGKAKLSGALEADFFGGFPAIGIGDNMGVVRLRQAYARLDWQKTSVVVGQDWMIFAPANPVSLAAAAIPLMAAAGNPWARLPQARVDYRVGPMLFQGGVMAPSTGDFSAQFFYQPTSGALSQVPFLQGRAAWSSSNWLGSKRPASIGVSGHYGRSRVLTTAVDRELDSRGVAVDWSVAFAPRLTLSGEAFAGRNLAAFQAGVFQGINPDAAISAATGAIDDGPRAIETRGGWTQLAVAVLPVLSVQATYGLDDPRDDTLASITRRDWRRRNTAYAIGFVHKLSPHFSWSLEEHRIVTHLGLTGRKTTNHLNFATTFSF
jgi:hypothetical protein